MFIGIANSIGQRFGGGGFDHDAQAFITAAGITDATQQAAINTLVFDLKADGIWSKMKAIYPFVGGTASTHKYNLKDPRDLDAAFRLVFNGGWTHSSTGATPNGTNGYADTKLNEDSVMTANSIHLSNYSRTNNTTASCEIGHYQSAGSRGTHTILYSSGLTAARNMDLSPAFTAVSNTSGFFINNRPASNSVKFFYNSSLFNSQSTTSVGLASLNYYVGARNTDGAAASFSNRETAFASIGDGLSDTEASNFYTAVQAFQTSLNRAIAP